MCRQVTCRSCGKPTWAGCGAHVEQVLGHVPRAERCQCKEKGAPAKASAAKPEQSERPSFMSRLRGGRG